MVGAPVIADLTGDGQLDLAVGDLEGRVGRGITSGTSCPDSTDVHTNPGVLADSPTAQDSVNRTDARIRRFARRGRSRR